MSTYQFIRPPGWAGIADLAGMEAPSGAIDGVIAGTSALTGDATVTSGGAMDASGTIVGTSSLSASPSMRRTIAGTIAGTSVLTGTPTLAVDVDMIGEIDGVSTLSGTAYFEEELLDGSIDGVSAGSAAASCILAARGRIEGSSSLSADATVRPEGMDGLAEGQSTLTANAIATYRPGGLLAGQSQLSANPSLTVALRGTIVGRSDINIFPEMTRGDLVTFVQLDRISPLQVGEDGGYPLDLFGDFPIGVPLIVRIGLTVTDQDSPAYSGKVGNGSTAYAISKTRLRVYTPRLKAGHTYSVSITSPSKTSALSQILEAMRVEQRTGVFGLRGVLPSFWKTGPRSMSDLND